MTFMRLIFKAKKRFFFIFFLLDNFIRKEKKELYRYEKPYGKLMREKKQITSIKTLKFFAFRDPFFHRIQQQNLTLKITKYR